jgi:hypothetical protein
MDRPALMPKNADIPSAMLEQLEWIMDMEKPETIQHAMMDFKGITSEHLKKIFDATHSFTY